MTFKLQIRVAKIMSYFNEDPHFIKDIMKEAYKIRSNYAHGGILSPKDIKKLREKYVDIKKNHDIVLHSLRISILIAITPNVSKEHLIKLIDAALIDKKQEKKLKETLFNKKVTFPLLLSLF